MRGNATIRGVFALTVMAGMCASAVALVPHPKQRAATRATVEALEEQWRLAQLSGDPVAMDKLLSDDFVGITATGQVTTKAQLLDRMRVRDVIVSRIDLSDVKVKLVGAVAIVTSLAEVVGTNHGEALNGMFRYTRIYERGASGTWRITNFEATRVPKKQGAGEKE